MKLTTKNTVTTPTSGSKCRSWERGIWPFPELVNNSEFTTMGNAGSPQCWGVLGGDSPQRHSLGTGAFRPGSWDGGEDVSRGMQPERSPLGRHSGPEQDFSFEGIGEFPFHEVRVRVTRPHAPRFLKTISFQEPTSVLRHSKQRNAPCAPRRFPRSAEFRIQRSCSSCTNS